MDCKKGGNISSMSFRDYTVKDHKGIDDPYLKGLW